MTTFTVTPNTDTGSITLDISQTDSITAITRSNVNGISSVRTAAGQIPSSAPGTTIVEDYEAAHGLNTYNVYHADGSFVTQSTTLFVEKPFLLVPIAPQYSEAVGGITDYSADQETFSTVHRIIGRSDPLTVLGKLSTRSGSLGFWTHSIEDANRLARVFSRGEAIFLKQQVSGLDMYFTCNKLSVAPLSVNGQAETKYGLTVEFTEVTRPYGDLAGAILWNFDALAANYASFDAVTAAFADFDALTLEDVS